MDLFIKFLKFHNPSLGELVFARVVSHIVDFMKADPRACYKVMIGSDSNGKQTLDIVSVIAVHRVGKGGRYFWCRNKKDGIYSLRQKIYAEVQTSLDLAVQFLPAFRVELAKQETLTQLPFDFQIHVDVGRQGETRDLIHEVTGMVRGYGYEVYVKPEAAAAMSFADRHVK